MNDQTSSVKQPTLTSSAAHPQGQSAKNAPAEPARVTRRNFLKLGLGTLGALAAIEVMGAGFLYLQSRSKEGRFGEVIAAGQVDDFPPSSVTEFASEGFFLVRAADGGFLAIYRRCPHLGCTVNWVSEKNRFYCPCHASSFDVNGDFKDSPMPRALDLFNVQFEEGRVLVDTTCPNQREGYSPDQLVYSSNHTVSEGGRQ
jgi:cytochrome b6-f complex iron-sulfur subunit